MTLLRTRDCYRYGVVMLLPKVIVAAGKSLVNNAADLLPLVLESPMLYCFVICFGTL